MMDKPEHPEIDDTTAEQPVTDSKAAPQVWAGPRSRWIPIAVLVFVAVAAAALTWLLTNIFDRQHEATKPFTEVVAITDTTYDSAEWGKNFPLQYEAYKRTSEMPKADQQTHTPTEIDPRTVVAHSKIEADPRLVTMWQGYAFSVDYREPRGHEYMLEDQQLTKRMQPPFKQPGACLNCHASLPEVADKLGNGDAAAGWAAMNKMPYKEAAQHAKSPIACIDCHEPTTMKLRITRPAFIEGIKELKASQGKTDYDVNRDATTQEMRSYVCAQCHVEYYFKGDEKTLTFPWDKGLTVYDAMDYYDEVKWTDFEHKLTGTKALKAQHPDFETWSQGIHAANGVSCSDCHMPYKRDGAAKVSDHQVSSPMRSDEQINASCLTCHHSTAEEMKGRVSNIQKTWADAKNVSFDALDGLIADLQVALKDGTPADRIEAARAYQRKSQFIIDYSVSENSKGFHAPMYSVSILNQATDWARKGQLVLRGVDVESTGPVSSATPTDTP